MLTFARGGCIVHGCQNKNPRERLPRGCEWRHAPQARAEDLGDFGKVVELRTRYRTRGVDFRASLRRDEFAHYRHRTRWGGCRWKSQKRKNVYLSPYVEKPLNSKVIKSFVPELRSRVFRVSGFLCFMYICYEHSMYVSHIRIWLWYSFSLFNYVINKLRVYKSYPFDMCVCLWVCVCVCVNMIWHEISYKCWYATKPSNQPTYFSFLPFSK